MLDLTEEQKILHARYDFLKKEYTRLFEIKSEMINFEENHLTALFLDLIGRSQYAIYCMKVDLAIIRKRITLIQAYINRNQHPDMNAIEKDIEFKFAQYQQKIIEEGQRIATATEYLKCEIIPVDEMKKLKEFYHLIVKRLHPDINPNLSEYEKDLFLRTKKAYEMCEVDVLKEILISLNINKEISFNDFPININTYLSQLEFRIEILKDNIEGLKCRFPFNYRQKIFDKKWIEAQQQKMSEEMLVLFNEKERLSEKLIILGLWKPESLN